MDRQLGRGDPVPALMKTATETRELITLEVAGCRILGTYHKMHEGAETRRTGVMFVHPGTLPRSAYGDAAVSWADSFAACGYPAFRFDLPGLGDSGGELPEKLLDFQSSVNAGDYALIFSAITQDLVARFDLAGLVLVGLCAGAVTALYAAGVDERVMGVVLMDPYFNLQGEAGDTTGSDTGLPSTANLPLIRSWNRVASSGRPILVLSSPSSTPKLGAFDYLSYLLQKPDRGSRVASIHIDGTNHSFAEYGGKEAVRHHTGNWLNTNFPRTGAATSEALLAAV